MRNAKGESMTKLNNKFALCALVLCLVMALASCQNIHIHTFDTGWTSDQTHHWQVCSSCQGIANKAEHDWDEGQKTSDFEMTFSCKTCQHTKTEVVGTPYSLGLQYEQLENGLCVVGIGDCQDVELVLPSAVDGVPVVAVGMNALSATNITSVAIPASIERLEARAFADCANLASVTMQEGVKYVGMYAFANCTSLETIAIPNSVTETDQGVFQGCTSLKSVQIGSGLATLSGWFFFQCTSLVNVTVPSNVTVLDKRVFEHCSNLESVVIGKDVTLINTFAFLHCEKLQNIYYLGTPQDWQNVNVKSSAFNADSTHVVVFYSQSQPTDTANKYWHYVDGEIVVW